MENVLCFLIKNATKPMAQVKRAMFVIYLTEHEHYCATIVYFK